MKEKLKDYFAFTRMERNGIVVLLTIAAMLLLLPFVYPFFVKQEKVDFTKFQKEIAQLQPVKADSTVVAITEKPVLTLHSFNPNTVAEPDLLTLGFSVKQAKTLLNYRNKGGKFYKKEDLKKVYGITDVLYARLETYIELENKKEYVHTAFVKEKKIETLLNLNTADSVQLVALLNIGPVLASRILKYRNVLGGYVSKEQLKEVYGLKEEAYNEVSTKVLVNAADAKKLSLNTASITDFKKQSYTRPYAKLLLDYRHKNGNYTSLEQAKTACNLSDEEWHKLIPYLTVD